MSYGCIYKRTFPSEKCYIGQTRQKPEKRWRQEDTSSLNKYESYYHYKIARAIRHYGSENIHNEVIDIADSPQELDFLERFYIWFFDSVDNSYNLEYGGNLNKEFSEETKEKMRASKIELYNSEKGESVKKRISDSLKLYYEDENVAKSMSEKSLEYYSTEEGKQTKKRISSSLKKFYQTEEGKKVRAKIDASNTNKYATLVKNGSIRNMQNYCIRVNGSVVKRSTDPYKLINWWMDNHPNEVLEFKCI